MADDTNAANAKTWGSQRVEWLTLSLTDDLPTNVKIAFSNKIADFRSYRILVVTGNTLTEFVSFVRYGDNWIIIRPYLDNQEHFWTKQITPLFDLQVTTNTTLLEWVEHFRTVSNYFAQSEKGVALTFSFMQQLATRNSYPPGTLWRQTCEEIRKVLALEDKPIMPANEKPGEQSLKESERVVKNKINAQKPLKPIIVKSPYAIPNIPLETISLSPPAEMYAELNLDDDSPEAQALARDYVLARYSVKELSLAHDQEFVTELGKRLDPRLRIPAYYARYTQMLKEQNGFVLLAAPYPTSAGPLAPVGYLAVAGPKVVTKKSKRLLTDNGSTVMSLAINPDHRRQGIATKLFLEALRRTRKGLSTTVFTTGPARSDAGYEFLVALCKRFNGLANSYATKTFMANVDGEETFTLETTKK